MIDPTVKLLNGLAAAFEEQAVFWDRKILTPLGLAERAECRIRTEVWRECADLLRKVAAKLNTPRTPHNREAI